MTTTEAQTSIYRVTISTVGMGDESFDLSAYAFLRDEAERAADDRATWIANRYGVQAWARVQAA